MYKFNKDQTSIIRVADNACIPFDEGNRDYAAYLGWLAADEANQPLAADPDPVVVPQVVSRFQARMALRNAGLYDSVEALMQDPSTPIIAVEAWNNAQEFHRDSPTIALMAQALGLTETDVDNLFIEAATIKA